MQLFFMDNYFLVFSNGEKIGDGIIKLSLLHEIRKRFSDYKIIWVANGTTVYANKLKLFSDKYIYKVIEHADLNPFFWNNVSNNQFLKENKFEYIFDTQKAVPRTIALKRLNYDNFFSNAAKGFFSNNKKLRNSKNKKYYLDELLDLLNEIKKNDNDVDYKIEISQKLLNKLNEVFDPNFKYLGIAPGAGEENKIWPIKNFIKVAKFYEQKKYKIVWFLGPEEKNILPLIKNEFPSSIFPEELIIRYSSIEIIMASTKYLSCALSNDSGASHILSTKNCTLIKLFGPKNSSKFTPLNKSLKTISSNEFNSNDIKSITVERVINEINNIL